MKELRSALGMVNFMRKFIPNLVAAIVPLVDVTKTKDAVQEIAKRWRESFHTGATTTPRSPCFVFAGPLQIMCYSSRC